MHRAMRRLTPVAALLVVLILGATAIAAIRESYASRSTPDASPDAVQAQSVPNSSRSESDPGTLSGAFRTAARSALPGVVHVQVEQWLASRSTRASRSGEPRVRQGSGSGFVFRPDGYILTNNHVIDGADRVTVVMQDRREFNAQVVGRDPNTDVAVIRVDAEGLPVLSIGNSDAVDVGDWVVALGYPLSLGSTATAGIVSAKGRSLGILRQNDEATNTLESFIQTDAAINPGNSGGPLVDLKGKVIGINSAIASPTGLFNGYGFAVPINLARRVAEDLIRFGEPHRPRLGVTIADVEPVDAEIYKLQSVSGAEITQITSGFPADRAGLQLGDVIVAIEGKPIASGGDLMEGLALYEPRQRVTLSVVRYGKKLNVPVELGEFEPAARAEQNRPIERRTSRARLGFAAADLTPEMASSLRITFRTGVVVTDVERSGGAARAQLDQGHVIERFNGQPVRLVQDLERLVAPLRAGDAVSMVTRAPDPRVPEGVLTIINFRVRG